MQKNGLKLLDYIRKIFYCDTENKEYWKEFDRVRLCSGGIVIMRKF